MLSLTKNAPHSLKTAARNAAPPGSVRNPALRVRRPHLVHQRQLRAEAKRRIWALVPRVKPSGRTSEVPTRTQRDRLRQCSDSVSEAALRLLSGAMAVPK